MNRASIELSVDTIGYSKRQLEKARMKFLQVYNRLVKSNEFSSNFWQRTPNFGPFPKITSTGKTIGSRLKRVATDSVSKRYQTSSSAQLSKSFLENVNFDLIRTIFKIQ